MITYRKANFGDVEDIYNLVMAYANDGIMLARSRNTLYETLRDNLSRAAIEGDLGTLVHC